MRRAPREFGSDRAFTLVETLLSIAIIAVLVALAIPSLARSRSAASLARVHAICAGLGASTQMYASNHRGFLPYIGTPGRPWEGVRFDGAAPDVSYLLPDDPPYFSQSMLYANLLTDGLYDGRASLYFRAYAEQAQADAHFVTPYQMTFGAFAAPSYWMGEKPPDSLSSFRAVGLHEAGFPSAKGLILHVESGIFDPRAMPGSPTLSVCLIDGSAGSRPADAAMWERVVSRPYGATPLPVLNTPSGLAGRDFGW